MPARRKPKRRRLKEDRLVTAAVRTSQFVQDHFTQVVGGVVVLLVAIAVLVVVVRTRHGASADADRQLAAAMGYFQAGDQEMASRAFQNLVASHSGRRSGAIAEYFLGESYLIQKRYDDAARAYESYLKRSKKFGNFRTAAMIGHALALEGLGEYRRAADALKSVAQTMDDKDPRYLDALYRAAIFYREAGDHAMAVELFSRVAEKASGELKEEAQVAKALLE